MSKAHEFPESFSYAFSGIKTALKNEPNFRIQAVFALVAIALGIFVNLSGIEWTILALTIFLVLILELINTSLEALVDLISPEFHEKAKVAKDVSAAAVLFSAIFSVIVALIIFLPKLLMLLNY